MFKEYLVNLELKSLLVCIQNGRYFWPVFDSRGVQIDCEATVNELFQYRTLIKQVRCQQQGGQL